MLSWNIGEWPLNWVPIRFFPSQLKHFKVYNFSIYLSFSYYIISLLRWIWHARFVLYSFPKYIKTKHHCLALKLNIVLSCLGVNSGKAILTEMRERTKVWNKLDIQHILYHMSFHFLSLTAAIFLNAFWLNTWCGRGI